MAGNICDVGRYSSLFFHSHLPNKYLEFSVLISRKQEFRMNFIFSVDELHKWGQLYFMRLKKGIAAAEGKISTWRIFSFIKIRIGPNILYWIQLFVWFRQ